MCYIVITGASLAWFLLSLLADMLAITAIVTPKWLIGPHAEVDTLYASNFEPDAQNLHLSRSPTRYPSVGIYTRCKSMSGAGQGFHCGPFDLDGFNTDNKVYPAEWKACMFFLSLGFSVLTATVTFTLLTCCRQSIFGKSIHSLTACCQVIAAISIMIALFLHPLAWGAERVQAMCGLDSEPFFPASCKLGISFYSAVASVILSFICAMLSLKAESANMRSKVKRRIEEGDLLVCIP